MQVNMMKIAYCMTKCKFLYRAGEKRPLDIKIYILKSSFTRAWSA
jgi:hypothetical protein